MVQNNASLVHKNSIVVVNLQFYNVCHGQNCFVLSISQGSITLLESLGTGLVSYIKLTTT